MDDGAALELEHARRASSALDYDRRALVQDAFFGLARARRTAHATALSLGGDAVTYGALADWAAAVAERLGGGVAVAGVRCCAAYAAVYGALASGAAYVPLAATSPEPRQRAMLEARARTLSSGAPKGVVVPHGCLVARVAWLGDAFGHPRALCCKTSYAFGVSEWELHWPLAVGGTGVLAPPGAERDPSAPRCCCASACSHVFVVSSVLRLLVDDLAAAPLPALSYVLQCGEALDGPLVERFYESVAGADLANVYGPTEASMTAWVAPRTFRSAADVVLVGTPVKNAFAVVLRAGSLDAAPPGEAGELCFGGILATGYVDGDAAAFPDAPAGPLGRFVDAAPKVLGERRLYRTGDAAVRGADGSLRVAGRLDRQVKASGRRVDLGELETALRDAGAREAHVSFVGDGQLVAAVAGDATVDWAASPDARRLAREAARALDAARAPASAPSGLSMSQFLASAYAADLAKAGVDSLGLVKAFKAGERADAEFLAAERRVVDNARAWGMFGVVVDHWTMNGAAPKVAQAMFSLPFFVDGVAPTTQRHPPLNTACSLALRSVGNGQSLFLFVLVDAYDDACSAASRGLALWTEPVFGARCPGVFDGPYKVALRGIGVDMDWDVVAVHRWYVLFQLAERGAARKLRALACFAAYFAGCAAWTRAHPVHDAMFFGSFKLEWGLGNPPVDSPMPVHLKTAKRPVHHKAAVPGAFVLRRFALEIGVNAGLAALMFCAAAASRTRCRLLGSTTLGAYVVHPYVLGDAVAFLRALKAASTLPGRLADAAQMALMLGLPAVFVVAVGPLSNALLLAPLRAGARLVCESALREAPGAEDDDAPPPPPSGSPRRDALHLL
ncbi:hypothetical protein JL722_1930 [Aureococcus anophagefferens]|nr:hypothetical protein JL722_1930 [Aureococcus anophagefferens]